MTAKQEKLSYLAQRFFESEAGHLYPTAHTLVFGDGNPDAHLVIVGEAPGAEEDLSGKPFVGRSGLLLEKTLEKAGLRRADVYICNVIKHRPPNNRDPEPHEIEVSLPWLHTQLAIIRPRIILAVGRFAANVLAGTKGLPMGVLRERRDLRYVQPKTEMDIPLIAAFHPAYVLRQLAYGPVCLEQFTRDVKRAALFASEVGGGSA